MKEEQEIKRSRTVLNTLRVNGIGSQALVMIFIAVGYFAFNHETTWQRAVAFPLFFIATIPLVSLFMRRYVRWANRELLKLLDEPEPAKKAHSMDVLRSVTNAPWKVGAATCAVWIVTAPFGFFLIEGVTPGSRHSFIDLLSAVLVCLPIIFLGQVLRVESILKPYLAEAGISSGVSLKGLPFALTVRKRLMFSMAIIGPYLLFALAILTANQISSCKTVAEAVQKFWTLQLFFLFMSATLSIIIGCYLDRVVNQPLDQIRNALNDSNASHTDVHRFDEFGVISKVLSERKALEQAKQEFFAVVSHELRSPLMAIQSFLGLMAQGVYGDLPSRVRKKAATAESNADRLVRLINDILDAEKLQSGKFDCAFSLSDSERIVERTAAAVADLAENLQVEVLIDTCTVNLVCDEERIIQVLVNFLTNAIKNSDGKPVTVLGIDNGDTVEFGVRDQGAGIPVDMQQEVFEKFKQLKQSETKTKGTGLGLPIAKALVEQHGGEIGVQSTPGAGSYFWARLPKEQPDQLFAALNSRN